MLTLARGIEREVRRMAQRGELEVEKPVDLITAKSTSI